jgi:hypothetical protein
MMTEAHAVWHEMTIRELPTQADQGGEPTLHLMAIREPLDADITKRHCEILALPKARREAFIHDCFVARTPAQSVAEGLRGRHDIIEQPDLAKIEALGEVKAEEIVPQRICNKLNKSDLSFRPEPSMTIVNLLNGHAGLPQ